MRRLTCWAAFGLLMLRITCPVNGNLIDLNGVGTSLFLPAPLGNPSNEAAWLEGELGLDAGTLVYLNKAETHGFAGGGAVEASSFTAVLDGATGTVAWDLTGTGYAATLLLVKDGRVPGRGFAYNLYAVSIDQGVVGGPDFIEVDGRRDISHATWFGIPGGAPPQQIADGGSTLALIGLALAGLGYMRRRWAA